MSHSMGRHIAGDAPRVMVVDGSRVVRRMIEQVLTAQLPDVQVIACATGAEARQALEQGMVDFVTVSLVLPDMDGMELARQVREQAVQAYVPIVVVSGDVDERLRERALGHDVTDYFDKSLGFSALASFIRGYVAPEQDIDGRVLYVEDSRVVALSTQRMLERHGLTVRHMASVEEVFAWLDGLPSGQVPDIDLVLTDVTLKGELTGGDLLERVRRDYGKGELPVLVMTGDDNPDKQAVLIRAGANDLVEKPVDETLLITKLMFQLRVARHLRERVPVAG
ncbi:response regulator [Oleiagrimonas sp. C23AA]|uniref:response regulator n=1 Tax=Oleiagrimonas sp. C23AA TaxID=2719047 RepID=UPI001420F8BF|nr:response regulator [Oleiagrimonas sp. C23AA]NII11980.1 response regulator [Oleiagrimonas sp. C23AA]